MSVIGQLILVEGTDDNELTELEAAVEEGVSAYRRRFPKVDELLVYMHSKTKKRWDVNGLVGGLEAFEDDDIPYPYVWIINAEDKRSFSPKKID